MSGNLEAKPKEYELKILVELKEDYEIEDNQEPANGEEEEYDEYGEEELEALLDQMEAEIGKPELKINVDLRKQTGFTSHNPKVNVSQVDELSKI